MERAADLLRRSDHRAGAGAAGSDDYRPGADAEREHLAASHRHGAAGLCAADGRASRRGRRHHLRHRHRHGLARHHVPVSLAAFIPVGLAAAHGDAGLYRRLCLRRFPQLCRTSADLGARRVRMDQARRLLVSGHPLHGRRHLRAVDGALSLCIPHRAGELHPPAGDATRSGPRAGANAMGRVPQRGAAAGQARHRRRRQPGPDGVPERYRRGGLLRRQDADARRLHDLARPGKLGRRGADFGGDAAVHLRSRLVRALGQAQAILRAALAAPAPARPHQAHRLAALAGRHRMRPSHRHRLHRPGCGADELRGVAAA